MTPIHSAKTSLRPRHITKTSFVWKILAKQSARKMCWFWHLGMHQMWAGAHRVGWSAHATRICWLVTSFSQPKTPPSVQLRLFSSSGATASTGADAVGDGDAMLLDAAVSTPYAVGR